MALLLMTIIDLLLNYNLLLPKQYTLAAYKLFENSFLLEIESCLQYLDNNLCRYIIIHCNELLLDRFNSE